MRQKSETKIELYSLIVQRNIIAILWVSSFVDATSLQSLMRAIIRAEEPYTY